MIDETKAPDPLPEALPIGTEFADVLKRNAAERGEYESKGAAE